MTLLHPRFANVRLFKRTSNLTNRFSPPRFNEWQWLWIDRFSRLQHRIFANSYDAKHTHRTASTASWIEQLATANTNKHLERCRVLTGSRIAIFRLVIWSSCTGSLIDLPSFATFSPRLFHWIARAESTSVAKLTSKTLWPEDGLKNSWWRSSESPTSATSWDHVSRDVSNILKRLGYWTVWPQKY